MKVLYSVLFCILLVAGTAAADTLTINFLDGSSGLALGPNGPPGDPSSGYFDFYFLGSRLSLDSYNETSGYYGSLYRSFAGLGLKSFDTDCAGDPNTEACEVKVLPNEHLYFTAWDPGWSLVEVTLGSLTGNEVAELDIVSAAGISPVYATAAAGFLLGGPVPFDYLDLYTPARYVDELGQEKPNEWGAGFTVASLRLEYTPVPEPGAIALLLSSLGLLALGRLRKR
ncbi:MAG: PEP-CTERM sorting domain-containing protein [Bryobacteraceae bacterium]